MGGAEQGAVGAEAQVRGRGVAARSQPELLPAGEIEDAHDPVHEGDADAVPARIDRELAGSGGEAAEGATRPGREVPDPDRPIQAGGDELAAAAREPHAEDLRLMTREHAPLGAPGEVPHAGGRVVARRGEEGAVGAEGDARHDLVVTAQDRPQGARGRVPQADGLVPGAGGERAAVRAEGETRICAV